MKNIYSFQFWLSFYQISVVLIFLLTVCLQIIPPLVHCSSSSYSESADLFRWRMVLFTGWAAYGLVPSIHFLFLRGFNDEYVQFLLPRILGMYVISTIAFLFYVSKFPERAFVGKINFLGTSHQIWHLLIFVALSYWILVVCDGVTLRRRATLLSSSDIVPGGDSYCSISSTRGGGFLGPS
jgi:predicted membrane channel-forming protein YqfA (hemolysin III family)